MTDQTKTNASAKYYKGAAEESLGKVLNNEKMKLEGEALKLQGQGEYDAIKNQGYAEGTKDKVTGTAKEKTGYVLGDESLKNEGTATKTTGDAKRYVNK